MKATGVVRRIDELGRIVIPKEIRKTLRIREGESLEIFLDNQENIVLKKYFAMNHFEEEAKAFLEDKDIYNEEISKYIDEGYAVAFSDGSFDEKLNRYSYGVVCIDREMNETELYNFLRQS